MLQPVRALLTVGCLGLFFNGCTAGVDAPADLTEDALAPCSALSVAAISASGNDGNLPANAIDGNLDTRWSSLGKGQFITADLGALRTVCAVRVAWYVGNTRRNTFSISVSSDGRTFNSVYSGLSSGRTTRLETYDFTDVTARYLRVTVQGNTLNDWASITELRPRGTSASPPPVDAGTPPPPPTDAGTTPPPNDAGTSVRPGASNTGVPSGTTLTVHNGNMTITTAGTVLDSVDLHGSLTIAANGVTVRRSVIRGDPNASSNGGGINVRSGTNVLIEDTEVALTPNKYIDGLWLGYDGNAQVTARRLKVSGGVDGIKAGSNTTIESSWIHDLAAFDDDPNVGGPTHNDCVQVLSGSNITVAHNFLDANGTNDNSGLQVTQDFGTVTNLTALGNWAGGGGCTFNFAHKVQSSLSGVTVTGNRFYRTSAFANCPILKSTKTTLNLSGNVWDDNGQTVPVQTHD